MQQSHLPPVEVLRSLLLYDPDTGILTWLPRPVSLFPIPVGKYVSAAHGQAQSARRWNTKHAWKEAFTARTAGGYRQGSIFNRVYRAHIVAWALHYGVPPDHDIDHEDGNPENNAIRNLRPATTTLNAQNAARSKRNTSGTTGVSFLKNRWQAYIRVGGKNVYVGRFENLEDAIAARAAAAVAAGFHENHGREPRPKPVPIPRVPKPPVIGRKWMVHDPSDIGCRCAACRDRDNKPNPVTRHRGTCRCPRCVAVLARHSQGARP